MLTIEVPMEVTRHTVRVDTGMVEVWGYVGDYEVMCCISIRDAIEKDLIPDNYKPTKTKRVRYGR